MSRHIRRLSLRASLGLFACAAFAYTAGDPLGGGASTVTAPAETATPPTPVSGGASASSKDTLQSLVDAYEGAGENLLSAKDASTQAKVAQATANAQVAATDQAVAGATQDKEQALASLKGYIDGLDADGNEPSAPAIPTSAGAGTGTDAGTAGAGDTATALA